MDIIEFIIEIFKLLFIAWYEGILEFNIWSWGLTLFVLLLFFGEKIFGEQSLKKKESTLKENIESNKISDTIEEKYNSGSKNYDETNVVDIENKLKSEDRKSVV